MGHFSISDLEQLSGIKAHTIRMWEQRYGLLRPVRTATNIRMYSDDDLRRLLNVTTLCGRGQRISQVAKLSGCRNQRSRTGLLRRCPRPHQPGKCPAGRHAQASTKPGCNHQLNLATRHLGFERMMLYVAYPLLQRIGLMWLAGTVNPAQEHLLAHLLRQKMLAATDALPNVPAYGPPLGAVSARPTSCTSWPCCS